MAVPISDLMAHLDALLKPEQFNDYCPNGLQVQGRQQVQQLVCGVTASQALIDSAIEVGADAVLVHHGFFWKGEDPCITGMKQKRIKALLEHEVNLIAYHLPLDAQPLYGNNVQLAAQLGITVTDGLEPGNLYSVGHIGKLDKAAPVMAFADHVANKLGRRPLVIEGGEQTISTVAWCTGAAQGYIEKAAALEVDAFLSGEISEQTVHQARELGIHYIAAGHHATERYGVQAVGKHLQLELGVDYQFIDIDNPV